MVNRWLPREETSKSSTFSAFLPAPGPAGKLPKDSNLMQIFDAFESALNQKRPASPTAFSAAAATFSVGNKTKRDVTGEE